MHPREGRCGWSLTPNGKLYGFTRDCVTQHYSTLGWHRVLVNRICSRHGVQLCYTEHAATASYGHEHLVLGFFDGIQPEARRALPRDFPSRTQIEREAVPRAHQNIAALVECDLARTRRIPHTIDDTSTDGCALVRAAVHDGAQLAAVQTDDADLASCEFDEPYLADDEILRLADPVTPFFVCHSSSAHYSLRTRAALSKNTALRALGSSI